MKFISTTEAAETAEVSPETIRRWISTGVMEADRVAGRWLIAADDLEALLCDLDDEDEDDDQDEDDEEDEDDDGCDEEDEDG
ncbi:MAG: helix-turn-helix domain-containing protein [Deltaproteobacteria bacterium]|nr:helix-turn-helix domain-containing protein [Deltaproteobacteria bacterium]